MLRVEQVRPKSQSLLRQMFEAVLSNAIPVGQQDWTPDTGTTGIMGANCSTEFIPLSFGIKNAIHCVFHGFRNNTGAYDGEEVIQHAYTIGSVVVQYIASDLVTIESQYVSNGGCSVSPGQMAVVSITGLPYRAKGSYIRIIWNANTSASANTYYYTKVTTASNGALYEASATAITNRATIAETANIPSANGFTVFEPIVMAEPNENVKVISLWGDSLSDNIEFYDSRGEAYWGWLARGLQESGRPYSLINFANAAARVEENVANNSQFLAWRKSLDRSDIAVVAIGTNDIIAGDSAATIIQKITQMVTELRRAGKSVYVVTLPPEQNTSTDEYITDCGDQNAGRLAIRRAVNTYIRSTFPFIDTSRYVSNGDDSQYDGAKWKLPTAAVNATPLAIAASPASTTTRIYWTTANDPGRKYRELYGAKIKFRSDTTTVALRNIATEGTGSNTSGANNLSDVSAALPATPATGDTFDIWMAYTRDGIHFAPGAVMAIVSSGELTKVLE